MGSAPHECQRHHLHSFELFEFFTLRGNMIISTLHRLAHPTRRRDRLASKKASRLELMKAFIFASQNFHTYSPHSIKIKPSVSCRLANPAEDSTPPSCDTFSLSSDLSWIFRYHVSNAGCHQVWLTSSSIRPSMMCPQISRQGIIAGRDIGSVVSVLFAQHAPPGIAQQRKAPCARANSPTSCFAEDSC